MEERVLVVGSGIAGLGAALALSGSGRDVTVIDRDPPPPDGSPDRAFEDWERKGVTHLRHSHAFLAVLYQLIRDNYPRLLDELLAAGCRELTFGDGLPETLRADYAPASGDRALTILTSRRTTLELVIRRYAERQPGIRFLSGAAVTGIASEKTEAGRLKVTGLDVKTARGDERILADVVVDAGGKRSQLIDWLKERGLDVREESAPSGILYYTRHYRLKPGKSEPERGKIPGAGDLGFIKYGVFPADNSCFSITLAVPEVEMEMRRAIVRPEVFDAICAMLPGIARWTAPETAEPRSRVFGMGELKSHWKDLAPGGEPLAENFFPIGDAVIRTNPLYGRGCSFGFIQAHILRNVLDAVPEPPERARSFHARVREAIRPFYDNMVKQDRAAIKRAAHELDPDYRPGLKARLVKSFAEDAITPALRGDVDLMRAAMKGFHMLEHPDLWLKSPANLSRVLKVWATPKTRKSALYPPKLGPDRGEMMGRLGLDPAADMMTTEKAA